jgi:AP-1 complex subunit mu
MFDGLSKQSARSISSLHLLSCSYQIILSREWRGETTRTQLVALIRKLKENLQNGVSIPIITGEDSPFDLFFIAYNDIYITCVAERSANLITIFVFLHKLISLFKTYFDSFEEESLRDNFVLIYELLDEAMDNGYPQITEPGVLKKFIKVNAHRFETLRPPLAATNSVSWRSNGIVYKKNEIFLDAVETCSLLVDASGNETHSLLVGTLRVRSQLSGMPVCELSLNKRTMAAYFEGSDPTYVGGIEDVKFHSCVDLNSFKTKKLVSFVPPDGKFDLMTYRATCSSKPLIHIHATVFPTTLSRVNLTVHLSTLYKEHTTATSIQIEIPVHTDTTCPEIHCSHGTVVYLPEKDILLWSLRNVKGNREFKLQSKVSLPSTRNVDNSSLSKTPIRASFEIPYYTASGLQVKYLKVSENGGFNALPWVRYITRAGNYEFRMRREKY